MIILLRNAMPMSEIENSGVSGTESKHAYQNESSKPFWHSVLVYTEIINYEFIFSRTMNQAHYRICSGFERLPYLKMKIKSLAA
jgi:hypothetical protein